MWHHISYVSRHRLIQKRGGENLRIELWVLHCVGGGGNKEKMTKELMKYTLTTGRM